MSGFRLATGGRIDRSRLLGFRFDGRSYQGHQGDTLASALLANGVHLMGRSFKYHRPRGPIAAGAEEPNALVAVGTGARHTPNLRATQVELYDGLDATSQNRWPSLGFDVGAVTSLFAPLLGAGFYYKTFMSPRPAWHRLYEPLIRRAAGLGTAPRLPDPDHYASRYAFCDVLVIGAGAAGLAAALAAAESGAQVILADEQLEMGGGLLAEPQVTIGGGSTGAWLAATISALAARDNVTLLPRTTAFGYFAQNLIGLCTRVTDHLANPPPALPRELMWKIRARQVVLATGAIERPLVFAGNDRPGIMLAGAARAFINRWAVRPGSRAVVFTADDSGYAAAGDLSRAGVEVAAIADLRTASDSDSAGLRVLHGHRIAGTTGRLRVAAVDVAAGVGSGGVERVPCDLVLMAGGWTPSLHLFSQSRGKLRFDEEREIYLPGESAQAERSAGACAGVFGIAACLESGYAAGEQAAREAGRTTAASGRAADVLGEILPNGGVHGLVPGGSSDWAFVDFQNDVQVSDITLAVREGFRSIEHIKRYTTSGMATDQGKTSNMSVLAIAADALRRPVPAIGLTTFRMPYTPVTFGSFAGLSRGMLFEPERRTPLHDQAVALGAVFEDVGQWKRARYFPRAGETMEMAVARECRAVRSTAGIFDASTLGKIEICGPDAAEFMNRIHTAAWSRLAPGRCRYGLLLNEAGFVMDDGVVGRLGADRFHVTTTTGGAAHVLAHMEDFLQTEFTDLCVWLTSVTEQWAVIAVQGPRARDVLAPLVEGIDLGPAALPHMGLAEGVICGVPTRLFRVSFTGELGFEVNVPAGQGDAVWQAIAAEGARHGVMAYGTEAMHVLRAEKGYIVVGQETDGTVTPGDLGLDWAIGKAKRDFVGKRSLTRPDIIARGRRQLVGLATTDPAIVLEEGAQITAAANPAIGTGAVGHVTSSYRSATLDRSIALALLASGRDRMGETVHVPMPGGSIAAVVCAPVFYDPEGSRLDG